MTISIIPLSEADPADVRQLLVRFWQRDWTETLTKDYFAWRYGSRGHGETLVASDGGRSVGIVDSFIRPYWIGGRRELVRETCDWFCLPEYQALGVGLHLMRRMMAKPEPILVFGGSEATLDLLPRLKWARLANAERFALPVTTRGAAGLLAHHLGRYGVTLARMVPNLRLARRVRRVAPPSGSAVVRRRMLGAAVEDVAKFVPHDFAPWLETSVLDWLASAPEPLGEFVLLDFFSEGKPVGVSISRLQMLGFGCTAHMVHVHAARLELIDWIVSETAQHLIGRGAGAVECATSCPATVRALAALGFVRRRPIQVHWWHATKPPPCGMLNLTSLRADDALAFG
jgi:hypothetical protein